MSRRDKLHVSAAALMAELYEHEIEAVTTEYVVFEVANFLSKIGSRNSAVLIIDDLINLPNFNVIWADNYLFNAAYRLYKSRPDKNWSLTDCASFVVMKERDISLAFTSDKHFEQAGFVKLLEN